MREPVTAYIGLGANLGDPQASLRLAIARIAAIEGVTLLGQSQFFSSAPVDAAGPDFFNAVVAVRTTLDAMELLAQLQALEARAGRERPYRNAPRTLDLDLLLYGTQTIRSAALTVPHPRMHERAFVLLPLAQLAPGLVTQEQLAAVAGQRIAPVPQGPLPAT